MRALVYTEPGKMELRELPAPVAGPGEVSVRVQVAGICGSDVHGFLGKSRIRVPPAIMGHEFWGTVAAVGGGVGEDLIGRPVVIQPVFGCGHCALCSAGRPNICPRRQLIGAHRAGGFADYVAVPERAVYPLPEGSDRVAGALVEPLANAVHMVDAARVRVGDTVLVIGAGTLGLLAVAVSRLAGAGRVVVTDTDRHRLRVARHLGADGAVPPDDPLLADGRLWEGDDGPVVVIEAVGIEATRRLAIAAAAPGATVVLLGNAQPESTLDINTVVNRELTLRGSYSSTDDEFRRAIALAASGRIDTGGWIEHSSLESGQEVFTRLAHNPGETVKVLFAVSD